MDKELSAVMEAAAAGAANKVTAVGAGTSLVGFVTDSQLFGIAGVFLTLLGVAINLYFKRKEDRRREAAEKRESEAHAARMRRYMAGFDPVLDEAGPMGEEI